MAELSDAAVLCQFNEVSLKSSDGCTDESVILTSSQRISVYNAANRQLLNSWFVKSGQQLTSATVQSSNDGHYSVIIDRMVLQSWSKDDNSIDQKSKRIKLSKPAHQLIALKNGISLVLNDDSTVAFSNSPATFHGQAAEFRCVVWCDRCTADFGTVVVAVFETTAAERVVFKYVLTAGEDSVQSVESYRLNSAADSSVAGYCLQSNNKNISLVTLYKDGRVTKTPLSPGENSVDLFLQPGGQFEFADVVTLDDLQIASVRHHNCTAFVEVWDLKYCAKHSESQVDLSDLGEIQHMRQHLETLFLVCMKGVFVLPFALRPVTLRRAMNCRSSLTNKFIQHCQSTGTCQEEITSTLSKLADASKTPSSESFKRVFHKLDSWLATCQGCPEVGLSALPLVDAVMQRLCDSADPVWAVEELKAMIKAGLVSNNVCRSLFEAIAHHRQFDVLLTSLTSIRDIPESAIVISLEMLLKKESEDYIQKFGCDKEHLINLVLGLQFNECFLMECIWKLEFNLVLELVKHLRKLWDLDKVSNMKICTWMYILSGSHSQQFNMFTECDSLIREFIGKVELELSKWLKVNVESEVKVDEAKLREILKSSDQRRKEYYISSFVHPFSD